MRSSVIASIVLLSQVALTPFAFAQQDTAPQPPPQQTPPLTTSPDAAQSLTNTAAAPTTITTTHVQPAGTTTTTQATVEAYPPTVVRNPAVAETSETSYPINRPLLATGFALLGGTYLASVIVGAESSRPADNPNLFYPVAGPWMDLGQRGCSATFPCSGEAGNKTLLILDGITQGVGALAMLTALFIPEKKTRHWFIIGDGNVQAAPTTVGTGYGVGAVGRF
jgi:hypothetical protein